MAGANGDALEWALALAKAPSERVLLRQRPLPDGIDLVLQIAAGHAGDDVDAAARRIGESREAVVDAVRFYLREVLFHPDADAYRVLGLARDAEPAQIKAHHRLLQHWLHPDRQTSEWDAAFAARVNAAWHHLRDTGRRQAYDAAHPQAIEAVPAAAAFVPVGAGWAHEFPDAPLATSERWRQRLPLLVLLMACVALGLLAWRDAQRDGEAGIPIEEGLTAGQGEAVGLELREAGSAIVAPMEQTVRATRQASMPASARVATPVTSSPPDVRVASMPDPVPHPAETAPRIATAAGAQPAQAPGETGARAAVASPPGPSERAMAGESVSVQRPRIDPVAARGPRPDVMATGLQPPAPREPVPTSAQVQLAQQVGDRLLVFMRRGSPNVPPIWDSLNAQQGASQIRDGLLTAGDVRFGAPDWRVSDDNAMMRTTIRQTNGVQGHLAAELVWREQRWLVRNLSLERDL